ncbi:MAG: ribosomal protein L11 methylase PrmA [Pirellulaceae bacterium]|jgi:ribosomal protein L11 methylase PrmA
MSPPLNEHTAAVENVPFALHPASFRDPSGFVYRDSEGQLLRQVNRCYEQEYRHLMEGSLYGELVGKGWLIEHEEVAQAATTEGGYKVIRPRELPFISYPYEWAFSALKDAALLTLNIQTRALKAGLSLKDASAYNVQFDGVRPIFIDSLSFEQYEEGAPWIAYGQFCKHFLAPLALMAKSDVHLAKMMTLYIDGIPLDIASKLLPWTTRWNVGLAMHLHWHSKAVVKHADTVPTPTEKTRTAKMSRSGLDALLDSLKNTIKKLTWQPAGTEWADYYADNSYSEEGFEEKKLVVTRYLKTTRPRVVWDLGANTGEFSRLATEMGAQTYAFDIDPACVERNYLLCKKQKTRNMLPLQMDLTNPSPAIGWALEERDSFADRGPCDTVMALALIHHLAISNNVPLVRVAEFFRRLGTALIIEFVPKQDPQVRRLLSSREDIFPDYTQEGFEAAFGRHYEIIDRQSVGTDGRVMYHMRAR